MLVGTLGFANLYAKRLYDDLLSNYNRLIRPVNNSTDKLTVWLNLKLSQLIEVVINYNLDFLELKNSSLSSRFNFRV